MHAKGFKGKGLAQVLNASFKHFILFKVCKKALFSNLSNFIILPRRDLRYLGRGFILNAGVTFTLGHSSKIGVQNFLK